MTGTLLYTVQCTFEDPTVARDWSRWLFDEHFDDLRTCGALSCELVRVDAPGTVLQARYRFADRSAFDAYVAEHADRMRSEGLARFPLSLGLAYERQVAVTVDPAALA